jgi:predicted MPP superfamily phosphohydrolase
MIYRMLPFFIIFTLVLSLVYYYIYRRLIRPLSFSRSYKRAIWIYMLVIPVLTPFSFLLRFGVVNRVGAEIIAWFIYLNLGFFSMVLALLIFRDAGLGLHLVYTRIKKWFSSTGDGQTVGEREERYNPSRRQFLINSFNLGIFGAAGILSGYGLYEAQRRPMLKEIRIPVADLPTGLAGFRIAQFTDVHVGPTIKRQFVESVVNQINRLHPDLIVCTGDMVDGSVPELRNDVEPVKDLYAPQGVFFVTGNHEYYSGALPWIEEMQRLGMTVLMNEHRVLTYQNGKIVVAGVNDYSAAQFIAAHTSDPHRALAGVETAAVKILFAHQPRNIFAAAEAGYTLQISGHTHGGQYIPWKYLVTLSQPYIAGLHRHDKTWIYVSRGTGYWGPPLRLGVPSEVTLFELQSLAAL